MSEMQRGLSRMADVCADALDNQAVGFHRQIQELQVSHNLPMPVRTH